jgi:sulfite oxidase
MPGERLIVHRARPLNAETPPELLCSAPVTPTDAFFVRDHGAIPAIDPSAYRVSVGGLGGAPLCLSLRDVRQRFPRATVTATLACAGNRRGELRPLAAGIPWGQGAVGTAVWRGARLRDVLLAAGIAPGARHVAFTGLDDVDGERFAGSIPLEKALGPEVVLADEMNGAPVPAEHGFPLRVVVPGYIGARSVKWLESISIQREPSASGFQRTDYALDGRPLGELALTCAACRSIRRGPRIDVEGYAIGTGGCAIDRVELSADGGRSWRAVALRGAGEPWAWRLWHANVRAKSAPCELLVGEWDASGRGQPATVADTWCSRGYMNNAWHRIRPRSRRSRPRLVDRTGGHAP